MERFKIDLTLGIAALLPYAQKHVMTEALYLEELREYRGPRPERRFAFPPYMLCLTLQPVDGRNLHMVSVSAQWRAVKVLTPEEMDATREAMADCFPGHRAMVLETRRPTAGYKMLIVPNDASSELLMALEEYKAV